MPGLSMATPAPPIDNLEPRASAETSLRGVRGKKGLILSNAGLTSACVARADHDAPGADPEVLPGSHARFADHDADALGIVMLANASTEEAPRPIRVLTLATNRRRAERGRTRGRRVAFWIAASQR